MHKQVANRLAFLLITIAFLFLGCETDTRKKQVDFQKFVEANKSSFDMIKDVYALSRKVDVKITKSSSPDMLKRIYGQNFEFIKSFYNDLLNEFQFVQLRTYCAKTKPKCGLLLGLQNNRTLSNNSTFSGYFIGNLELIQLLNNDLVVYQKNLDPFNDTRIRLQVLANDIYFASGREEF